MNPRGLIRQWGPLVLVVLVIALGIRATLFVPYSIPSRSMAPTLTDGDRVIVNKVSYAAGEVDRGQVVVFERPQQVSVGDEFIKRIIGLPGETIRFVDNKVYIDGLRVVEPYLAEADSTRSRLTIEGCDQEPAASDICLIPEGHVFVMGDNRSGSTDSRMFGPIEIDSIVGRAFWRVWPLGDIAAL